MRIYVCMEFWIFCVSVEEIWPFYLCVSPHLFKIPSQILPPFSTSPHLMINIKSFWRKLLLGSKYGWCWMVSGHPPPTLHSFAPGSRIPWEGDLPCPRASAKTQPVRGADRKNWGVFIPLAPSLPGACLALNFLYLWPCSCQGPLSYRHCLWIWGTVFS